MPPLFGTKLSLEWKKKKKGHISKWVQVSLLAYIYNPDIKFDC